MDPGTRNLTISALATAALLAALLAWVSNRFGALTGWFSFLVIIVVSISAGLVVFRLLQVESPPPWLARLTAGAALLRLAAGVAWFLLLPAFGYDTDVQQAGYIMEDAFRRDTAAWALAESDAPLWGAFRETEAFGNPRAADQYGGYLFISASIYRLLGTGTHQPLLIVVLSAGLSALAVPIGWAFTRRLFDERTARLAAWGLALFPEAVLLGSSQMREGLTMPLAAAAFYGLALFQARTETGQVRALAWMVFPLVLLLPISPSFVGILVVLMALIGLGLENWRFFRSWQLWLVLAGILALVLVTVTLAWEQIAPRLNADEFASPIEMAGSWLERSARWQARQSEEASGWLQRIFESTPEWFNLPFLVAYGVTRPLLPAQLAAGGIPVWWAIGLWRSLGWTLVLLPLLAAPILAVRKEKVRGLVWGLVLAAWASILIASFWGGGDQWDNPRYRVAYFVPQIVLAAYVVAAQLREPDPWVRRAVIAGAAVPAWFMFWYLRRYTIFDQVFGWTVVDVFKVLGAGVYTGVILAVWDSLKE